MPQGYGNARDPHIRGGTEIEPGRYAGRRRGRYLGAADSDSRVASSWRFETPNFR
jgi:hypothetical protein